MLTIAVILMIIGFANAIRILIVQKLDLTNVVTIIEYVLIILYATIFFKKPHGNLLKILILIFGFLFTYFAIDSFQSDKVSAVVSAAVVVLVSFMAGRLNRYKQNVIISIIVLAMLAGLGCKDFCVMHTGGANAKENGIVMQEEGTPEEMPEDTDALPEDGEKPHEEMNMPKDGGEKPQDGMAETDPEATNEKDNLLVLKSILGFISFFNMAIMWTAIFFGYCSRYRRHAEAGLSEE